MIMWPSLTFILCGAFVCYIGFSLMVLVDIFFPKSCATPPCLNSYLTIKPSPEFELKVYTSKLKAPSEMDMTLIWNYHNFTMKEAVDKHVNVSIPLKTRNNGSLYAHVFFHLRGREPFLNKNTIHTWVPLTSFTVPQSKVVNLLTDKAPNVSWHIHEKPVTHWKSKLTINIVQDELSFQQQAIPKELFPFIKFSPEGYYLPIVFIDELSNRLSNLQPINKTTKEMELKIIYSPISMGKLRLWTSILESMKVMQVLGFKDKDLDEVKGIFTDTNLVLLLMTFAVSAFHLLFDFLAFKHDINFWRGKKSMEGLSSRGVIWRCISTIIIFLYLLDQETSLLVLVPSGLGALIEIWKVKKAFKMNISWNGWRPLIEFGTITDKEQQTEAFDSQAMKYLSYVLYPLCISGACYSLIYIQYKSWYSWFVNSLVNGIYLFGFLFMLPQLFVNYKLKSVAHLPWRAFMYKAFNTFIDDVFAFIITMPTAHRLACFRDDVVFMIYLYQRWLYPVDKSRVNEFGVSYEEEVNTKDEKQKKED